MGSSGEAPSHAALERLRQCEGRLLIGGLPVDEVCGRAGRTPVYAYDWRAIHERVAALRSVMPRAMLLHYAIKANPMPELVRRMAGIVDGFDVASGGELGVALASGMPADQVSFAGPGKSLAELRATVTAGATLHVESERELGDLQRLARDTGVRPRLAIRVNPDFQLKAAGMKMGGGAAPFGVDAERVPEVLRLVDPTLVDFRGFHIFAGSQSLRADAIGESQLQAVDLASRLARDAPGPVHELNIGGGFGIPYFAGERPLDEAILGRHLATAADRAARCLPGARLIIELGRYLVGEAGYYICRIVDRKVSRGRTFLVTDGGLHQNLAASGNFGQVIRKNYPVVIGTRMDAGELENVTIVGPLCTPLDLLGDNMQLARADVGDLVVVLQAGAYGLTASPRGFLSHPEPAELLI